MNRNLHLLHLKASQRAYTEASKKTGVDCPHQFAVFNEYAEIFANLIIDECIAICKEHGDSAAYSYTPSKTIVAQKIAYGCAELISRTLLDTDKIDKE